MARRAWLISLGVMAGLLVALVGAVMALLITAPGHRALRRYAVATLTRAVDGQVQIGEVSGALWRAVDIRDVTLATRDGKPVIQVERVRVTYGLGDLMRRKFRLSGVTLVRPVIVLEQGEDRHWNIDWLFKRVNRQRDTTQHKVRPLVDLRDVVVTDGTLIVRERPSGGAPRQRTFTGLNASLARLRPSHPDSTAIEATFQQLALRLDDPGIEVRDAQGTATLDGDSVRFELRRLVLPATETAVNGLVRWGHGRTAITIDADAERAAFADLRGVVPRLPGEGGGRISLLATLPGDGSAVIEIRTADVQSGRSAVSGRGTVAVGARGGVSVRGLEARLHPLDLALLTDYVDSLPVRGLVSGRLGGSGPLTDVAVDAALTWTDEATEGAPENSADLRGQLTLGGADELVFRGVALRHADFAIATIGQFAPSVVLDGRLRASGSLEGPWRDAQFRGTLEHAGPPGLVSTMRGDVRLGLYDTVHVDADLTVDSLSFQLLRRTYPQIPLRDVMRGRASLRGPLTALAMETSLEGATGALAATGTVGVFEDVVTVVAQGTFDSLDISRIKDAAPPSALWGRWTASLRVPTDSLGITTGTVRADLARGRMAGVALGQGATAARLEPARLEVDFARLAFAGGTFRASGALGRGTGAPSRLNFDLRADTIGYLEPLARWSLYELGDSASVRLDGSGTITGRLAGTLADWRLDADAAVSAAELGTSFGRNLRARGFLAHGGAGYTLDVSGSADTLAAIGLVYAPVGMTLTGSPESLTVRANAGFLTRSAVRAAFTVWTDTDRHIRAEMLEVDLPVHHWRLQRPAAAIVARDVIRLDTVELRSDAGVGYLRASGTLPRTGLADFVLVADSVSVADIYATMQRDTAGISGALNAEASVSGPGDAPTIDLRVALTDGRFGDYRLPLFQVLSHYEERRLTIKGGLWRDTLRLVAVNGSLPIDLSFQSVPRRLLPGAIEVVANADSLDMTVLDPLVDLASGLSGQMALDVRAEGTWDSPRYTGYVDIAGGGMTVPALGASYHGIDGRLTLQNNVMSVARGQIMGGEGVLDVGGTVTFDSLLGARPDLDLTLRFSRFTAFDLTDFGGFTGTGEFQLQGPLLGATLSGRAVVDQGYLQFADLVQKRIVSLDDPEFRAMVDSSLAQARDLGPEAHVIFLDSLRIRQLAISMGNDVWLRSGEANIQLAGAFVVDKAIESQLVRYRMDGTLHATRGTYKLVLGVPNSMWALNRDFRVTRGTVRFFGTPDFNPDLDIAAENIVRTVQGQQLTVRALIGGTLLYPRLRLESDQHPPLTETEIVSYLMFGQPPNQALSGSVAGASLAGSMIGGVSQALAGELGLPLSYLSIQAATARQTSQGTPGVNATRIEAGYQVNDKTFLTLNAGLCEVMTSQAIGGTVEYRLSTRWTASAAIEPVVQSCATSTSLAGLTSKFQFGFDLFWQQGIR